MPRAPRLDATLPMLAQGYAWFPDRRRATGRNTLQTRVMGLRTLGLEGPAAAEFFYDERNVQRRTAMPEPVLSTLFGHGAVHTLDGEAHRVRKALFLTLLTREGVTDLVGRTAAAWDAAVPQWADRERVVLFQESAQVLTRGVSGWAGLTLDDDEVPAFAADLTAMVDGFATAGRRHWRARRARARREAWLAGVVQDVRRGATVARPGSALDVVARHRDLDGQLLHPRVAAVELLNTIRPTVAVAWFMAFSAHALHRWPEVAASLRAAGPEQLGERGYAWAFAHEVRRFYPFAPFTGGRAARDLEWDGERVPAGSMVLLDIWGQDHDPELWEEPFAFRPERFVGREIGPFELIPQGGGSPVTGHRCPGEDLTIALLQTLVPRLAALRYEVPEQDLEISLRRIPALPASRVVLAGVRPAPTGDGVAQRPAAAGVDAQRER
ncbi:cytochrome P450 [Modestobacter sp. I12A-02628]|uniref:Cytochrome P450 n=1 Tax=Goekera deserti TaxID=2497753 RepID=A0A7K3WF19_9ACTN|nr:cytochrome P450 [Goekera deserti]MPQ98008.1 cytochrome P450 [Goekera deserti]NDI48655.1 cytochrome P450 [Goekera deserti]NEL54966.1 cytochrome P450 [Goekera deserti]